MTDFYEDDEPVDRVVAAFERGDKAQTVAPDVLAVAARQVARWQGALDELARRGD